MIVAMKANQQGRYPLLLRHPRAFETSLLARPYGIAQVASVRPVLAHVYKTLCMTRIPPVSHVASGQPPDQCVHATVLCTQTETWTLWEADFGAAPNVVLTQPPPAPGLVQPNQHEPDTLAPGTA